MNIIHEQACTFKCLVCSQFEFDIVIFNWVILLLHLALSNYQLIIQSHSTFLKVNVYVCASEE